jgi:DNA-binding IclR family transcriptional regulator
MQLVALKYFVAVADHGSFNAAAERLGVTPSTLTRSVSTLEDDLGLTLFERSLRGVLLTPGAASILAETKRMLASLQAATDAAEGRHAEQPESFGWAFVRRLSGSPCAACSRAGAGIIQTCGSLSTSFPIMTFTLNLLRAGLMWLWYRVLRLGPEL